MTTPSPSAEAISWLPWEPETFSRAKSEDKPVVLSLTASWCHWCHVMDQEAYSHPEVMRTIAREFIPVRVDTDRRPDINARYNMGGWPTVAILLPDGGFVTGATYLESSQLLMMLREIAEAWKNDRGGLAAKAAALVERARERPAPGLDAGSAVVEEIAGWLIRTHHEDFGGFMGPPQFPNADALALCQLMERRTGEPVWRRMAIRTLDGMADGEIHDRAEGGFFRYATRNDWSEPHYEKLLDTNVSLIKPFADAASWTGDPRYLKTAANIADFLDDVLARPDVGYAASQDSDRDYFHLPLEERLDAESPRIDATRYSGLNAAAASALVRFSIAFLDIERLRNGIGLLDWIWEKGWDDVRGLARDLDHPNATIRGYLTDQVHLLEATLDAFEATGDRRWMERAKAVVEFLDRSLSDPSAGAYRDLPAGNDAFGALAREVRPLRENASAALSLLRLAVVTGRNEHRDHAASILRAFASDAAKWKVHASLFAIAVDASLREPVEVRIVGRFGDPATLALIAAARALPEPWTVCRVFDPDRHGEEMRRLHLNPKKLPSAYLCLGKTCLEPAARPDELRERFGEFDSPSLKAPPELS